MQVGLTTFNNKKFLLVDIPGTYSIMSNSDEEEIARDYICFGNPNCTVVVVDATCLERNLNLVYQILEITDNVVVCVNLLDEAKKKGISIDLNRLSTHLGVPVVGSVARKRKSLTNLMSAIATVCENKNNKKIISVKYSTIIENSILMVENSIKNNFKDIFNNNYRWISLKLLDGNVKIINSMQKFLNIDLINNLSIQESIKIANNLLLENGITSSVFKDKIVSTILFKSENIAIDVTKYKKLDYNEKTVKIDKILTSKITGIPIMILFFCFNFLAYYYWK
jgi:ferrous iron transport protein B